MDRRRALVRLGVAAGALAGAGVSTCGSAAGGAEGAPPAAGNALPDWTPAPGTRRNISRNVMADVDPCPARTCAYSGVIGQRAVLEAWCGAAFATDYGRLGAWITTGGGHGDYFGNEVYAFELDSQRWVRLNDPYPGGPSSTVDYAEGEYAPGIPLSAHTYQHTQYLSAAQGGGPKGSLLTIVAYAAGKLAQGSGRAHMCDLASGRWTRYSQNKAAVRINATSATCFDPARNAFWRVPYGGAQIEYLAVADRRFRQISLGAAGGTNFGVDHVCAHDPVRDLLVVLDWRRHGPATVWALDLANPLRWREIAVTGPVPETETQGMSLEWCPPLRCLVGYEGRRAPHVRKLLPPQVDPQSNAWRWEIEELGGDEPVGRDKGPGMNYSRFRFAPAIRSFVWADDHRLPVQAWRLRGT